MNKTKIIATIGQASASEKILEELLLAGMNVARLNFSQGDINVQQKFVESLRKVALINGRPLSIMLDTFGPKIKVNIVENDLVNVSKESKVTIYTNKEINGNQFEFSVNYPDLINDVNKGDIIFVNSKSIRLEVLNVDKKEGKIECTSLNSGVITSNCLVNIPGLKNSLPFISTEDASNINFANKMDVDYIALSFVRDAKDVLEVKEMLKEQKSNIKVYAKIENKVAVDNFDSILFASDGIIIPRGDLSNEIPLEILPLIQKRLIKKANQSCKPVIVGTQVLSSMTRNKQPSRAEVSDVANLILDGVDGISLSNVTTVGQYPVKATKMLYNIIVETEKGYHEFSRFDFPCQCVTIENNLNDAVASSVRKTAESINAKLIVAFSESGATSKRISLLRPTCPIASVSSNANIRNELSLFWGIYPVVSSFVTFEADFVAKASEIAEYYGLKEGDSFIITGGNGIGNTNFMKVCKL